MQIYFGKVNPEELSFYDPETLFSDGKGNFYFYTLEVSEEGIHIADTCNRYVPIAEEALEEMKTAMFLANAEVEAKKCAQAAYDKKYNEIVEVAKMWGLSFNE